MHVNEFAKYENAVAGISHNIVRMRLLLMYKQMQLQQPLK